MSSEDLFAVWAAGFYRAVGVEDDLPAPAVDAYLVVILAEERAVLERGLAAVGKPARRGCWRLTTPACSAIIDRKPGGMLLPILPSMPADADIPHLMD